MKIIIILVFLMLSFVILSPAVVTYWFTSSVYSSMMVEITIGFVAYLATLLIE